MGTSRNGRREEAVKFSISGADAGQAIVVLQVIPDLLYCCEVRDSGLDQRGHAQGNITNSV